MGEVAWIVDSIEGAGVVAAAREAYRHWHEVYAVLGVLRRKRLLA
jgi:hypothetical protein